MPGTRDSKLEHDFSMKKKKNDGGEGTKLPRVFFTEEEVRVYIW